MTALDWSALLMVAASSVSVLYTVHWFMATMRKIDTGQAELDRRDWRQRIQLMGTAVGSWQITVGIAIVMLHGMWAVAIAPMGMGGMFWFGAWLSRKLDTAPWWAPGA